MCLGDCIWEKDALRHDILETHYTIDFPDNCDYVDYDSAIKLENTNLSLVQLNIRGMYNKLPELIHLTDRLTDSRPLDVLMLCETWLTKHTPSFSVPGYNIIRNDRLRRRGGGVSVLVSKRLKTKDRPELTISSPKPECCGIEIIKKTNPIIVISAYRLPNTNPVEFITRLTSTIHTIKKDKNASLIVGLDHNLDFLKSSTHAPTHKFIDEMLDLGMFPTITRPTRITHQTATLIDNILVDQWYQEQYKSSVIIDHISDHLLCFTTLCGVTSQKNKDRTVRSRDLRTKYLTRLKQNLADCKWDTIIQGEDACEQFTAFHTHLDAQINNFCPIVNRKVTYKNIRREPWVTSGLLTSIKNCKKLYKLTISAGSTDQQKMKYSKYNASLRKTKRAARRIYYLEKCEEFKHNTKQLWKTINSVCGRTSDKTTCIDSLKVGNVTT